MSSDNPTEVQANKKFALVIGNSYTGSERVSGVEDARGMADSLERLGFSVLTVLDGKADEIKTALKDLRAQIAHAEVVLFFYSGHGYQLGSANYLLPVGSAIDPANPEVSMDKVFRSLSGAPDEAVKIVLLDACRSNADLPVVGGGTLGGVPGWNQGLAKPPGAVPPRTLFGYAAVYGQTAASGPPGGFSPYSSALLGSIREPGLEIRQLLARVGEQVFLGSGRQQSPQEEGLATLPENFVLYLSPPVFIHAESPGGHNDLLVILNGEIVLNTNQLLKTDLRLNAGDNELVLLVSNGGTHRNGLAWERTEGWSYRLDLVFPGGKTETFEGHEDIPFKDGPHYGKVFTVARARIHVHPGTAETTLLQRDADVWNREAPVWAQDQGLLFEQSITDLNLSPEEILGGAFNPGSLAPLLRPFLVELLRSGKILGITIADPRRMFVTVRGNLALKSLAEGCMGKRQERIDDLKASIAAAFNRNPTPFDIFDHGLMKCMLGSAQGRQDQQEAFRPENIRIWTAIEDRGREAPTAAVAGAAVATSMTPELAHQS